jgi:hypothetical protein
MMTKHRRFAIRHGTPRHALVAVLLFAATPVAAAPSRERAIEQIPELMGRILESQEEIRERESEMHPVMEHYAERLGEAREGIDAADTEDEAADALVSYVEAYAARTEAQEEGLASIEASLVRMRSDARALVAAAEATGRKQESPEVRQDFFQDHFQGVAAATAQLAERLGREDEAATSGAVLHASWASHGRLDVPIPELGPDGAVSFARKVDGLYAQHQARSNQVRAERHAVRRLLDVLIERQLSRRLDSLFAGGDALGLGSLLSGEGKTQDWGDLGLVVSRALGLPDGGGGAPGGGDQLERLDYFANGDHRE